MTFLLSGLPIYFFPHNNSRRRILRCLTKLRNISTNGIRRQETLNIGAGPGGRLFTSGVGAQVPPSVVGHTMVCPLRVHSGMLYVSHRRTNVLQLGKILQSVRRRRHGRHRAPQVQHAAIANAPPGQSVEPRIEPSASGDPKAADYDLPFESQQHSHTNAIGLKVVFVPEIEHTADIVFVHGLGGTSQGTWTKNKDPKLFWPSTFLPNEPGFKGARILTFGYDATFRKYTEHAKILYDFGQDLLYDLKHGKDYNGDSLNIGSVSCHRGVQHLDIHLEIVLLTNSVQGAAFVCCSQHGWAPSERGAWIMKKKKKKPGESAP